MELTACNLCGSSCQMFLELDAVPPVHNLFCLTAEEARRFPSTGVSYAWCVACQHISIVKMRALEFDGRYNNDQTASRVAMDLYHRVATEIENAIPDRGASIVEIGCGRGELVVLLSQLGYTNLQGYDPAAPANLGCLIRSTCWTPFAKPETDLLILRHTLEAIPTLDSFVEGLSASLTESGMVYCEITNASKLLREQDLFSLFPEYSNLFSIPSISLLFSRHGLFVERVVEYYGGEWVGVWFKKITAPPLVLDGKGFLDKLRRKIAALPQPVVLWGAGGRGGNILSLCSADLSLIPFVVDLNQAKQGKFIPPFGQEIIAPARLSEIGPATILVSNRKYKAEVAATVSADCMVLSVDELYVTNGL